MTSVKHNKNGLGRYMRSDVRRKVRQRDGFGCVKCGSAFYQFDHLGIEFAEADLHDPDKIILLCGACHDRKNRKNLSTETLLGHARSPQCKKQGFSSGAFDVGQTFPQVVLGNLTVNSSHVLIEVNGEEVFSIKPPELKYGPYRINAKFYNKKGRLTLEIIDNETRAAVTNWDVVVKGPRIIIQSQLREFDLVIRSEPPHRLVVERLDMSYKGFSFKCIEGGQVTIEHAGNTFTAESGEFCGCDSVITVENNSIAIGGNCESMVLKEVSINQVSGLVGHSIGRHLPVEDQVEKGSLATGVLNNISAQSKTPSRNSMCGCGSGRKYKRCHGSIAV